MTNTLTHPTRTHVQLLRFMHQYLQQNDQLPGNAAIAAAFGWASTNAASEHLARMERLGLLCRNEAGNVMLARTQQVAAALGGSTVQSAMAMLHPSASGVEAFVTRDATNSLRAAEARWAEQRFVTGTDARLNAHIAP